MSEVVKLLPESEPYFPADMLTDQPERVLIRNYQRKDIKSNKR